MRSTLAYMVVAFTFLMTLTVTSVEGQGYIEGLPTRWNVYDYPNPYSVNQEQQRMCRRYNQSYVCDPNAVISPTQANDIDAEIKTAMAETPCHCVQCRGRAADQGGYKFRVAIMRQLEPTRNIASDDRLGQLRDTHLYAYILSNRWQMDGLCNETVLIIYSRVDRLVYTFTMPGAKLRLSNDDVTRITMLVRPYFEDRETIADGIIQMIRRYSLIFNNRYIEAMDPEPIQ